MHSSLSRCLAAFCLLTACGTQPAPLDPERLSVAVNVLPEPVDKIDVLFIIDDSGSMAEERAALAVHAENALFDLLGAESERPPSLHIAATTSSLIIPGLPTCESAQSGELANGCADDAFLTVDVDEAGNPQTNFPTDLSAAISCLVVRGDQGCGFEQPLLAMEKTLDSLVLADSPFLRDDALLAVVFLTDEDDCSAADPAALFDLSCDSLDSSCLAGPIHSYRCFEHGVVCDDDAPRAPGEKSNCRSRENSFLVDVAEVATKLKSLKDDPAKVVVTGLWAPVGPVGVTLSPRFEVPGNYLELDASCQSDYGFATPAIRLSGFLDEFPGRSTERSICDPDFEKTLAELGHLLDDTAAARSCLRGQFADLDPALAGLQPGCRVYEVEAYGLGNEVRHELAPCTADTQGTCFSIAESRSCSHASGGLELTLEGARRDGTHLLALCEPAVAENRR